MRLILALLLVTASFADQLAKDGIVVEYSPADKPLAELSLRELLSARADLAQHLPNSPPELRVLLCNDYETFRREAGPYSSFAIVGVALPRKARIVLKAPNLAPPGSDYAGTVRHELVHILLEQNLNTDNIPRWLNEGLAMVLSGENRWASRSVVAQMYIDGRILTYRELEASFLDPGQEQEFGDAYAQAYSMTQFLMRRLEGDRFWQMLRTLDTQTFGSALDGEFGMTPHDFWSEWKSSLGWLAFVFSLISGLSLFQMMALLTVLGYLRKRRKGKVTMAEWDAEEQAALADGDTES